MIELDCSINLPAGLQTLYCYGNQLTSLDRLPTGFGTNLFKNMSESIGKYMFNALLNSRPILKVYLKQTMKVKITEYNLKEVPFVINPRVGNILKSAYNNPYGGMKVIMSPAGSGKTTYLRYFLNKHIDEGGAARMFGTELNNMNDFYISFGSFERRRDLFEVLPLKSVIVIDQLEHLLHFPPEMENLLLHLACESRRTAECNVIVSTSNINLAKHVLKLNGNDKISKCGKSEDFQWTEKEVKEFITAGCSLWKEKDRNIMLDLGMIAKSPSHLHSVFTTYDKVELPVNDLQSLYEKAKLFADEWKLLKENGF